MTRQRSSFDSFVPISFYISYGILEGFVYFDCNDTVKPSEKLRTFAMLIVKTFEKIFKKNLRATNDSFKSQTQSQLQNQIKNEQGFGLIEVMISAGLVIILALTISYFVYNQSRSSGRLERSAEAINVASSVIENFRKDEASLFISTMSMTADNRIILQNGFTEFANVPAVVSHSTSYILIPSGTTASIASSTWTINNHLNIRNTMTRLMAMVITDSDFYCGDYTDGLDDSSCDGEVIFNNNPNNGAITNLMNVSVQAKNVTVYLAVDFNHEDGSSPTAADIASGSDMPHPARRTSADFNVKVVFNQHDASIATFYESRSRTEYAPDSSAPLTLMQLIEGPGCNDPDSDGIVNAGTPYRYTCDTATAVRVQVRSVQNRTATSCEDCLEDVPGPTVCDAGLSIGTYTNAWACTTGGTPDCSASDPGAMFVCRIGEVYWFDNPSNADKWEPCNTARIHRCTGGVGSNCTGDQPFGTVAFTPVTVSGTGTARYSEAIISISGYEDNRGYKMDVRAIDTSGWIGPSFCSSQTQNCQSPLFVIASANPSLGTLDASGPAVDPPISVITSTGTSPLENHLRGAMLAQFGPIQVQCQPESNIAFNATVSYTASSWIWPDLGIVECQGSFSGTTSVSCNCNGGTSCSLSGARVDATDPAGNYDVSMSVRSLCSAGFGPPATFSWCFEKDPMPATANVTNSAGGNATAPLFNIAPIGRACGLMYACPDVTGVNQYQNAPCTTVPSWNSLLHSGCTADLTGGGQFCAHVKDVCGRSRNTNQIQYSTKLTGSTSGAPSTNYCGNISGVQVEGNSCTGSSGYCAPNNLTVGEDFICRTDYPLTGQACNNAPNGGGELRPGDMGTQAEPCRDSRDCPGVHGACGSTYRCVSNTVPTDFDDNVACTFGDACSVTNVCQNIKYECLEFPAGPGRRSGFPDAYADLGACTFAGCTTPIGQGVCSQITNSGACSRDGGGCDDVGKPCDAIAGTCSYMGGVAGTCQAPANTNATCDVCSVYAGTSKDTKICPALNSCYSPIPLGPSATVTCGGAIPTMCGWASPVTVTVPATCSAGGTITTNYSCLDSGGGACGTCTAMAGRPTDVINTPSSSCLPVTVRAGCFVDSPAWDNLSQNSCGGYGCTGTNRVVFSVGNIQSPGPGANSGDNYRFSPSNDFTVNWAGDCTGSGAWCIIGPVANATYTATATVNRISTGESWVLPVSATKATRNLVNGACPNP